MALELYRTSKHNRLYREVLPDGRRQGYVRSSIRPMHFESTIDSGDFDTPVDMTVTRVTNAQIDGYMMTNDGWHYAVQTVDPALSTVQPNSQRPAGTVGFGGRKGQNWFRFRLRNVGYVHWPTRAIDDLGGQPDYSQVPVVSSRQMNLAKHSSVPDKIVTNNTQIDWGNIWSTPGGGELSLRWSLVSGKMKEDVIINQAAREWLQANRPPSTPNNETWFGFRFQLDVSDIPRAWRNGIRQNMNNDDFDDDEGDGISFTDGLDRLLAFMPLDTVSVPNRGGERNLRKRFYRQAGQNYLFVGVRVDQLAGLLPGDLVFDPSITQETIATNADDIRQEGTFESLNGDGGPAHTGVGQYSGNRVIGVRFTPPIPQGASLTGGGSEYAGITLYRRSFGIYGTPLLWCYSDVDSADQPVWAVGSVDVPDGSNFTRSTAFATQEITSDPGQDNAFPQFDCAGATEEITDMAGWAASQGMRFIISGDTGSESIWVADSSGSGNSAVFDAFYTTAGGGANPKGPLGMPLFGPLGGPLT